MTGRGLFATRYALVESLSLDYGCACVVCEQPLYEGEAHYLLVTRPAELHSMYAWVDPQPNDQRLVRPACFRCVAACLNIDAETLAARADNMSAERYAREKLRAEGGAS